MLMNEFDYIAWLRARTPAHARVPVGPGDDCAVLATTPGIPWLATTAMSDPSQWRTARRPAHGHRPGGGQPARQTLGFYAAGARSPRIAGTCRAARPDRHQRRPGRRRQPHLRGEPLRSRVAG